MSLQVVRVLIGVIVSIRKVDARIRPVIIEPAFHFTLSHNYLLFFADLTLLVPQSLVDLRVPQSFTDLVFLTFLIIFSFDGCLWLLPTKIL